jgi:hypothetical protein
MAGLVKRVERWRWSSLWAGEEFHKAELPQSDETLRAAETTDGAKKWGREANQQGNTR